MRVLANYIIKMMLDILAGHSNILLSGARMINGHSVRESIIGLSFILDTISSVSHPASVLQQPDCSPVEESRPGHICVSRHSKNRIQNNIPAVPSLEP